MNDRSIKWKNSVDETAKFVDGDFIPSVLVRNKIDLIEQDNDSTNDESVREFAEKNRFINVFKTSAKMGIGIDECMEFLITSIIERMEKCTTPGKDPFQKDARSSIVLQAQKAKDSQNEGATGGCC